MCCALLLNNVHKNELFVPSVVKKKKEEEQKKQCCQFGESKGVLLFGPRSMDALGRTVPDF